VRALFRVRRRPSGTSRAAQDRVARVTNGSSVDPDTLTGIKEAKRHERATLNYLEARDALRLSGAIAERVVTSVCIAGDCPPASLNSMP